MKANDLLGDLGGVKQLPVSVPDATAWELSDKASMVKLLERLLASGFELTLEYSENPIEDQVPGHWEPLAADVWVVPGYGASLRDTLYKWLSYGNWVLYHSSSRKVWRMGSHKEHDKILDTMRTDGISVCLYSFHDNDPWFLFTVEKEK